jgi:hypothetical protein
MSLAAEMKAVKRISGILDELDLEARARVLAFVTADRPVVVVAYPVPAPAEVAAPVAPPTVHASPSGRVTIVDAE